MPGRRGRGGPDLDRRGAARGRRRDPARRGGRRPRRRGHPAVRTGRPRPPRARARARTCARARPCCGRARRSAPAELGHRRRGRPRDGALRARCRASRCWPPATSSSRPAARSAPASCTTPTPSRSARSRAGAGADARSTAAPCPTTRRPRARPIGAALDGADVLLLTGGVSVGPHDHVKPALVDARRRGGLLARGHAAGQAAVVRPPRRASSCSACPATRSPRYVTFLLFARPALAVLQGRDGRPERERARARRTRCRGSARARTASACASTTAARCRPGPRARTSSRRCSAPTRWPSCRAARATLAAGTEVEIERI